MKTKIGQKFLVISATILLMVLGYAIIRLAGFTQITSQNPAVSPVAQSENPTKAEPVVLTDEQGEYPLGLHLEIFEDTSGELSIEDVSAPAYEARFVPSQVARPNYGFTDSAFWVRVHIYNNTHQTNYWLLNLLFPNMNYVDLYSPAPGGEGFTVKQSGSLRPPSTRDILHREIIFRLLIPNQTEQTFYLRFKSSNSMTMPLTLWRHDTFLNQNLSVEWLLGLLYGILIGLIIYNTFLFFSIREISYLYHVLFLIFYTLWNATYDGYLEIYLFTNLYFLKPYYIALFFCLMIFFTALFGTTVLDLKTRLVFLHRILLVIIAVMVFLLFLLLFFSYHVVAELLQILTLTILVVLVISAFILWRRGYTDARYFSIAWFGWLISIFIGVLVRLGIMPSNEIIENTYRLGAVWVALGMSIALADRINLLKRESENANRELRGSQNRLSQILEGMPLGVTVYGLDQKPKYFNKRASEILSNLELGIKPDLSAKRTLPEANQYFSFRVSGTDEKYPLEKLPTYRALHGESTSVNDLEAKLGDKYVQLEVWASPVKDDEGRIESAVTVLEDITQRKQGEAELAEYRSQLEEMVKTRTATLNDLNNELRMRYEFLAAINHINQIVVSSTDFARIYEEIILIIQHLFKLQDAFIAEMDVDGIRLNILAHTCLSDIHPVLIGTAIPLPENLAFDPIMAQEKLLVYSKEQFAYLEEPIGLHFRESAVQNITLAPLRLREETLGFLGLEMREEGRILTLEESNLLAIFSTDIAQLIADANNIEKTKLLIATEERNRLARELHDSVAQTLYSISLFTDATRLALETKKLDVVKNHLEELVELSREAMSDMRLLIYQMRSPLLEKNGLAAALQSRLDAVETRAGFKAKFYVDGEINLTSQEESELYRIAQEALNNVIKHAHAEQVRVELTREAGCIRLTIEDDGVGFDLTADDHGGGQGFRNIRERAESIGARYLLESTPGQGTKVTVEVNK